MKPLALIALAFLASCGSNPPSRVYLNEAYEGCLTGSRIHCQMSTRLEDQVNEESMSQAIRVNARDNNRTERFRALMRSGMYNPRSGY